MDTVRTILGVVVMSSLLACASTNTSRAAAVPCAEPAVALVPRWVEPAEESVGVAQGPASRTVITAADDAARFQTVRIQAPPERDPVDVLLGARRGARRIQALELRDAPVADTLRMFADMGGFNVVFADEVGDRRVTLRLRGVSLASAFRTVLSAAHLGANVVGGEIVEVRPSRAQGS
jgi:hypothetical protein